MVWICAACEFENEDADAVCAACEEPRPDTSAEKNEAEDDEFKNYRVGRVVSCEAVPGAKLKQLKVDVGEGAPIDVLTAATNLQEGSLTVIACVGAMVKGEVVKKTTVRNCPSSGIVCDGAMLGWSGGGVGAAVILPETFKVGERPPPSRPRGDAAK